ncbi:MAG: AMP-binding protein [Aestuariivita sp.]|nr:AMP-binding protein [Aestuariivita sp.]MCY4201225.1 AMP-binding protein [Aestuariivita sp.]
MKDLSPRKEDLEPIELASRDEIESLQFKRLSWSLNHAYSNVALYRALFDAADIHPDDLSTLADLTKFPLTTKQNFRDNYPFGMFAVPRDRVIRIHASSGTTGQPTVVGYTEGDLKIWGEVVARSLRASGLRAGDLLQNAYGYGLFTGGLGVQLGADALKLTTIPVSGGMTSRQVRLINDFEPNGITVTPSYALSILDEFVESNLDPRQTSLNVGIFGAEPWSNAMRQKIENAFDMHAVDIYGLSEVIGPGVANECVETKDGLHIWEDHFLPEIIDPITEQVLPEGQLGELVLTSLTKEALPVIRYRTGDLTRLLPGTARSMKRMVKVVGRNDDMIILRGVNLFPSQLEEQILAQKGLAPHFQIELSRPKNMDQLRLLAESTQECASDDDRAKLGNSLATKVKSELGISISVDVSPPGTIKRSQGKAVRLIDHRPRD